MNSSDNPQNNVAIQVVCIIMVNVTGSVDEAEIGATFINARYSIPELICLEEMGYLQPPTKVQIDNTTEDTFTSSTLKQIPPK